MARWSMGEGTMDWRGMRKVQALILLAIKDWKEGKTVDVEESEDGEGEERREYENKEAFKTSKRKPQELYVCF